MIRSAETRWFFEQPTEIATIEKWFNANDSRFKDAWDRADLYLLTGLNNSQGIKLREGKLEIKTLEDDLGTVQFVNSNYGKVNTWGKFSFQLDLNDAEAKNIQNAFLGLRTIGINRDWVSIRKERLLVKYAYDKVNALLNRVKEKEFPAAGCGVELTRIQVNLREVFYSIGFEAFGSPEVNLIQLLEQTVNKVFEEARITMLSAEDSYSYPEFLLVQV